jgi:hypothetical protein
MPLPPVRHVAPPFLASLALVAACALAPRPTPRFSLAEPARERLARAAPDVTWRWDTALSVNLDGDGLPDLALLGAAGRETVVGVVLAAVPAPAITRLAHGDGQAGTCAPPLTMTLAAAPCRAAGEPPFCAPTAGQRVADPALEELRLEGGGCAPFHFYFDGGEVIWWRP